MAREITKLIQELLILEAPPKNNENPELAILRALILRDRVENVLNRSIVKTSIAFCIHDLLANDGELIAPYLSNTELHDVLAVYNQSAKDYPGILPVYFPKFVTDPQKKVPFTAEHRHYEYDPMGRINTKPQDWQKSKHKSFTLPYFHSFKKHETKIQIMVTSDTLQEYAVHRTMLSILFDKQEILDLAKEILDTKSYLQPIVHLRHTRDTAIARCYTSPYVISARNKILKRTWTRNEKATNYLNAGKLIRRDQLRRRKDLLRSRVNLVKRYESRMVYLEERHEIKLEIALEEVITKIEKVEEYSEEYTEELKAMSEHMPQLHEKFLVKHLAREKNRTARHHKHETVFANFIDLYDTEIQYLYLKRQELRAGYTIEKNELRDMQEKWHKLLADYQSETEQRDLEEKLLFEAKCRDFVASRSVKRIQRWWRGILLKRKAKRKSKKGKGKKK